MKPIDTVLLTGISGYLAGHCARELLQAGYRVRGTLRDLSQADRVRRTLNKWVDTGDRLEFAEADLKQDAGWQDAAHGCGLALHVASPLPAKPPKDENELILPARDGALRVLRACADAGVRRVVMTSSIAAVMSGHKRDGSEVYNESHWSVLENTKGAYERSKTIAERAAWEFVRALPADRRMELVTIAPGLILGPLLYGDARTSAGVVKKLLNREIPGCPDMGWAMVDVRDLAAIHVAALNKPDAAGERFICTGEHHSMSEIAEVLHQHFAARGFKIPRRRLPNWIVKTAALFDKTLRNGLPALGRREDLDASKAKRFFGWTPRPFETMVVDLADSLIELGAVKVPGRVTGKPMECHATGTCP